MNLPENFKENFTGYILVAIVCFGAGWGAAIAVRHQAELETITKSEHQEFLSCGTQLHVVEERAQSLGEALLGCESTIDRDSESVTFTSGDPLLPDPEVLVVESEDSVFVSDTPAEIFARSVGTNDLQSEENFRRIYVGKKLRVRGPVSVLRESRLLFRFQPDDSNFLGYAIEISLRSGEIDKVSHVSTGTVVTAEGVISSQTLGIKVFLDDGVVIRAESGASELRR